MNDFKIKKGEMALAVILLIAILLLNSLIIFKFSSLFINFSDYSYNVFMRNFHMSGFDPITYDVVTDWTMEYNLLRHPLLPFFMFPLFLINKVLWIITGANCVQFVIGLLLIFCSFYSFIFMYRIFHDVLDLDCKTSGILLLFFFSFAYIMITIIVPDHFCISLFLIIYTLYFAGKKIKESKTFSLLEMSILFVITAGVTLSNGIIVLLSVLFTNGKSLFKYKYITTIFLLSVAMLGLGLIENQFIGGANPQTVKSWVDVTTPRVDTIVENMFGESIQLHRKYLLGDVLVRRPVIVRYSYYVQYVVEALIFLLFIAGICVGRRSRYMWLYVSCFMYAVLLHVVIGFGVNEVYIMSAHWIYVIPVAIAFLIHGLKRGTRFAVNTLIIILSSYLLSYNGYLLYHYLTWPLSFD